MDTFRKILQTIYYLVRIPIGIIILTGIITLAIAGPRISEGIMGGVLKNMGPGGPAGFGGPMMNGPENSVKSR